MTTLWQDVRYGLRLLARSPGLTAIVVVVLAVGIGATTAVFGVVNAVVLRPLCYKDPDRIVIPWEKQKGMEFGSSVRNFIFLREQNQSFEHLAGYSGARFYVTGIDRPHHSRAIAVSPDLFPLLGVPALFGRKFLPREEQRGNDRVVVVSHAFWVDHLRGTPDAVGRILNLDEQSYTIVGVMPPQFRFPFVRPAPFWVPLVLGKSPVRPIARLKKGVTLAPRRFTMILLGLFSGIALILAMVGVYGLLQYSTTQQTHDIGIRMALGARGIDVLRAVLVQGLRPTFLGITIGLAGVFALTRILSNLLYGVGAADPLTFALVAFLLAAMALLASYLPARRAARIDPMVALRYE